MTDFQRSELSFEQAEGVEPLPAPMALKHMTPVLRARLWNAVILLVDAEMAKRGLRTNLGPEWAQVYNQYLVVKLASLANIRHPSRDDFIRTLKPNFEYNDYAKVLGTIEWLIRNCGDSRLSSVVEAILLEERCAYRLIAGSIVPIASREEGEAVVQAVQVLSQPSLGGAKVHLLKAGSLLTSGDFAGSVRESVHAVESTARSLTGETSLLKALQQLAGKHPMHPALSKGFNTIYGYTSDANGIRHPIVGDEGPKVGEPEAIFMLGACASFVTYLVRISE